MKNKIFTLVLFIFITGIFFVSLNFSFDSHSFNFKSLTTDSGFDSDYDYDYDYGDNYDYDDNYDFDSDYDSGSDSDSNYVDSSSSKNVSFSGDFFDISFGSSFIMFWIFIAIVIFGCKVALKFLKSLSSKDSSLGFNNFNKVSLLDYFDMSDSELSKFNIKNKRKLLYEAFNIYSIVQESWMEKDLEIVRSLLSDNLYATYSHQVSMMKRKEQKNIMADITFVDGRVNDVYQNNDTVVIKIILEVTCKDYIIDELTQDIVRGSSSVVHDYLYELIFERKLDLDIHTCPSCHSELPVAGNSLKCEYCGSIIKRKSNSLVLTSKKMLNQSVKQ